MTYAAKRQEGSGRGSRMATLAGYWQLAFASVLPRIKARGRASVEVNIEETQNFVTRREKYSHAPITARFVLSSSPGFVQGG